MKKGTIIKVIISFFTVLVVVVAYGVDHKIIDFNNTQQTIQNIKNYKKVLNEEETSKKQQRLSQEIKEKEQMLKKIPSLYEKQEQSIDTSSFEQIKSMILNGLSYFNYPVEIISNVSFPPKKIILTADNLFPFDGNGHDGRITNDTYKLRLIYTFNKKAVGGMLMPSSKGIWAYTDVKFINNELKIMESEKNYLEIAKGISRDIFQEDILKSKELYLLSNERESLQKVSNGKYTFTIKYPNYEKAVFEFDLKGEGLKVTRVQ